MRRSVNSVRISIGNESASLKSSSGEDIVREYSHPKDFYNEAYMMVSSPHECVDQRSLWLIFTKLPFDLN